jgi:hypothetical protein
MDDYFSNLFFTFSIDLLQVNLLLFSFPIFSNFLIKILLIITNFKKALYFILYIPYKNLEFKKLTFFYIVNYLSTFSKVFFLLYNIYGDLIYFLI